MCWRLFSAIANIEQWPMMQGLYVIPLLYSHLDRSIVRIKVLPTIICPQIIRLFFFTQLCLVDNWITEGPLKRIQHQSERKLMKMSFTIRVMYISPVLSANQRQNEKTNQTRYRMKNERAISMKLPYNFEGLIQFPTLSLLGES